jgi:hypothetical protein
MKINPSAIESASGHRVDSHPRAILRRRLAAARRFAVPACILLAASLAEAGQPLFAPAPSPISPVVVSPQMQNSVNVTANSNQAVMNQIIGQLNRRQLQSQIATANFAAQRPTYLPQQTISVKRGK